MRNRLAVGLGLTVAFFAMSAHAQQTLRTQPFGFRAGMTKAEVIASVGESAVKKDDGDTVILTTAPRPHREFDRYIVLVSPHSGVAKVVGLSEHIETNSFGEALQDKFRELKAGLEARYGKATRVFDFLTPGSTWNEPADWMVGLLNKERWLDACWDPDQQGSSIIEETIATSSEEGYISITYEFANFDSWKQEHGQKTTSWQHVSCHTCYQFNASPTACS